MVSCIDLFYFSFFWILNQHCIIGINSSWPQFTILCIYCWAVKILFRNFRKNFICVHERFCLVIFYVCFLCFGYQDNTGLIASVEKYFPLRNFEEFGLESNQIISLALIRIHQLSHLDLGVFFLGRLLSTNSISLIEIGLVKGTFYCCYYF